MNPSAVPPGSGRTPARWGCARRMIVTLLVLLVLAAGGILLWLYLVERDWQDALAEADRADPGWTAPELEARRAEVTDVENSARRVLAAYALRPDLRQPWQELPEMDLEALGKFLRELPPNAPLTPAQFAVLKRPFADAAASVAEVCMLKDLPKGRYPAVTNLAGSAVWGR